MSENYSQIFLKYTVCLYSKEVNSLVYLFYFLYYLYTFLYIYMVLVKIAMVFKFVAFHTA